MMKFLALILAAVLACGSVRAQSTCTCTCFDGRPLGTCTNPGEVAICTPDICPPKPSVLHPLPPLAKPVQACKNQVVWNELTKAYEYREVCSGPPQLTK
jgi:hypothetical protein